MNYSKQLKKSFKHSLLKKLFIIYHFMFPSRNRTCRFDPTCSQYLLEAVDKHGFIKGFYYSLFRLLSCNPISTRPFYDPVK